MDERRKRCDFPLKYRLDPINGTRVLHHFKHQRLLELLYLNDYSHMVSVTMRGIPLEKEAIRDATKSFLAWLNGQVVQKKLRYIAIPDVDKEFNCLCFYVLINDVYDMVPDGVCEGRTVYKISDWPYSARAVGVSGARKRLFYYLVKLCDRVDTNLSSRKFWYR